MESRFQRLFLVFLLLIASGTTSLGSMAQEEEDQEDEQTQNILDDVINPDIERRRIDEDKIDVENFELGFYSGVLSVEDFGTNNTYGLHLAYHITEDWFFEFAYGSTQTSETSFELLSGGSDILTEDQRKYDFYNLSLGLTIFPGEIFIARRWAFNTNFYVIGGAGNTLFADNQYFTTNFGAGFRLFMTDWLAFRADVRNHIFTHNLFGADKSIQNLEATLGFSIFY